ncbi:MAG: hypothetical protein R3Y29_03575 [bacterium]
MIIIKKNTKIQKERYTHYLPIDRQFIIPHHERLNLDITKSKDKYLKPISNNIFELTNDFSENASLTTLTHRYKNRNNNIFYRLRLDVKFCNKFNVEKGHDVVVDYDAVENKIIFIFSKKLLTTKKLCVIIKSS